MRKKTGRGKVKNKSKIKKQKKVQSKEILSKDSKRQCNCILQFLIKDNKFLEIIYFKY